MARIVPREKLRRAAGSRDLRDVERDLAVLKSFARVYCRAHHDPGPGQVCRDCAELVEYARLRLLHCPYDPKPKCKECPTHCYQPEMRRRVRNIMRFSGMYFVRRGRLDWLIRYFLTG